MKDFSSSNANNSPDAIRAVLEHHLASPEMGVKQYLNKKVESLGEEMRSYHTLYLDTKYWVFLRDAELGRAKLAVHDELLRCLRMLVQRKIVLCPVSDVAVMELTAQSDEVTRKATGTLLDELSGGIAIQSERTRVQQEIDQFLRDPMATPAREALSLHSWTKACFVLGPYFPVPATEDIDPLLLRAIQKGTIDSLWDMTFSEQMHDSSASLGGSKRFNRTAEQLNKTMRQFQHEIPSFAKAFLVEIVGVLSVFQNDVFAIWSEIHVDRGGKYEDVDRESLDLIMRAIVNSFKYRRDATALCMPTLYSHAMCHAAIRMDVMRKLNGNFLRDLHHGTAGVVYYDAMFTERSLKALVTASNVALNRTFNCEVISEEAEALAYLQRLSNEEKEINAKN